MSSYSIAAEAPRESLSAVGVFVLALGALDFGLEQSIIVPALPSLAVHYGTSVIGIAWLATGFLLAAIIAVPLVGRCGDLFGKKRMLLVSLGAFAIGSVMCAVTSSIALAIAGRAVQGLGAAVAPLTLGLARDTVAPNQLPRMVAAVIGSANVGGGIGFLASGVLVDTFSPAAIFWFLFIAGVALAAGVAVFVRESPVRTRVRLDPAGALLLSLGLVPLLLAISKGISWGWASAEVTALFAAAGVGLTLFALLERGVREPLVDFRLVTAQPFAGANLCAFAFGYAFFVAVFVIPQIAAAPEASGYGLGLSITKIGLLLAPTSFAGLVSAWLGGRVVDRFGSRALVTLGSLVGLGGYLALALDHDTWGALAAASAAIGVAWGLILTGIYPIVLRGAANDETGIAPAVTLVFRNTAVSAGVTVASVLIAGAGLSGMCRAEAGFTRAFLMAAGGAAIALVAARLLPGRATAAR